jgi:hypothetical protein
MNEGTLGQKRVHVLFFSILWYTASLLLMFYYLSHFTCPGFMFLSEIVSASIYRVNIEAK